MAFRTTRPLHFGDCDPSGIAYFPSYLNILVGVLEEFFATIGAPWSRLMTERQLGTPTVKLDCTFVKPGLHGDLLHFTLRIRRIGTSSLDLDYEVGADGDILWTAAQRVVLTSLETHKAVSWPDDIRSALAPFLES